MLPSLEEAVPCSSSARADMIVGAGSGMSQAHTFGSVVADRPGTTQVCLVSQGPNVGRRLHHHHICADLPSPEIFDEYTRRQYVAKAPQRNPFGVDEEPKKFAEFDVSTKIRVLQQLSAWTLNNPDRIRERLDVRDVDQTQWVSRPS